MCESGAASLLPRAGIMGSSWNHHGGHRMVWAGMALKDSVPTFHENRLLSAPSNLAMEASTSAVGLPRGRQGLN